MNCEACNDTGTFESGVCHCGDYMDGYHDNHSPVEMVGPCPYCEAGKKEAAAVVPNDELPWEFIDEPQRLPADNDKQDQG